MSKAQQIEKTRRLLDGCDEAIDEQQRIIRENGRRRAYDIALESLRAQKNQLETELAELEASDPDGPI